MQTASRKSLTKKGLIDDEVIDAALERLFLFYERTKGVYEPFQCDFEKHHEIAVKASEKSLVLLKNEDQLLPLDKKSVRKLLIAGENAVKPYIGGDGSSRVANPTKVENPLEEIKKIAGDNVEVEFFEKKNQCFTNEIGYMENNIGKGCS